MKTDNFGFCAFGGNIGKEFQRSKDKVEGFNPFVFIQVITNEVFDNILFGGKC